MKLTKAQQAAWDEINNRLIELPDNVFAGRTYSPPYDYKADDFDYTWYADRVYGSFNTATLKALEKKRLIKVHKFGGSSGDIIEVV